MNFKNHLQKLSSEHLNSQKDMLHKQNEEVLNYIKKTLENQARKGKDSFSFKLIKLSSGDKYQVQTGEVDAIEFTSPEYLKEELEKEGLNVSLLLESRVIKNKILNCNWKQES